MKRFHFVLLGLASVFAQSPVVGAETWAQACSKAKAQPLAEPVLTGPLSADDLPHCDSEALYYGIGAPADYAAALQCAWYQRAHPRPGVANMNYGVGVLTMLYANGRGVQKNVAIATRFACEQEWAAPAEMEGRVWHLSGLKDGDASESPFDMCDDATSGLSGGFCQSIRQRLADGGRDRKLAAIAATFTLQQRSLFDSLRVAEEHFNDLRTGNEIDMTGSARASFVLMDLGRLRDQFLVNLQRMQAGDLPQATATDVKDLDASMNELYQRIMAAPDAAFEVGTVRKGGIRDTQRAWLSLRDAWIAFAKATYPGVSADVVAAQLVRLRTNQLQRLPVDIR
jgi:uncharacterized protein YecT (DUF1311 family)